MTANPVLLSFGGNLGNVEEAFDSALSELEKNGFHSAVCSRIYRSPAMGCERVLRNSATDLFSESGILRLKNCWI